MTHGFEGTLMASDKEFSEEELWNNFTAERCPTLEGKPKLFFIQACRGAKLDLAVRVRAWTDKKIDKLKTDAKSFNSSIFLRPSSHADILVMYSTQKGYVSFRDRNRGSIFIQALVTRLKLLVTSGGKVEIYKMLLKVNREVSREISHNEKAICRQTPSIQSSLMKEFLFGKKVS
jgi:caspase 7